jgi:Ca2+:H+ antiporter
VHSSDPDDEPEQPQLTITVALLTLGIFTVLVAVCAEFMVRNLYLGGVGS